MFSSRPVFDSVFASYGYPPGSAPYQAGIGVNADGTLFTIGNGAEGSVVNFRGERDPVMFNDRNYNVYNFAPDTALLLPLERSSVFLRGTFALTDAVDVYLQALYADYSVERQLAPAAAGIALIPATNPFIPADLATLLASRSAPSAPYRYFRRAGEVGPQAAENQRDVLQVTAGTRGKFAGEWDFDLYAQFGQNDRIERQTNNVSLSQLQRPRVRPGWRRIDLQRRLQSLRRGLAFERLCTVRRRRCRECNHVASEPGRGFRDRPVVVAAGRRSQRRLWPALQARRVRIRRR